MDIHVNLLVCELPILTHVYILVDIHNVLMTRSTQCAMTNITFLDFSLDYFRYTAVRNKSIYII